MHHSRHYDAARPERRPTRLGAVLAGLGGLAIGALGIAETVAVPQYHLVGDVLIAAGALVIGRAVSDLRRANQGQDK